MRLVTDPVASFIAPGGHSGDEAANLTEVRVSMSGSTLPRFNLHLVCTLQSDLKNNLEVCSKQREAYKKKPMHLKGATASTQQVPGESDSLFVPVSEIRPNKSR